MQEPSPASPASEIEELSSFVSWKQALIFFIFATITPITIFASFLSFVAINKPAKATFVPQSVTPRGAQIYAALPQTLPAVAGNVIAEDARIAILAKFLELNKSPMAEHAAFLVTTADKYQLDWKLLPAIAQKESGLCRVIPPGSHNCWGWGIHSKGTLMFDSYDESIETVAKGLKEKYIDMGYTTTEKIMSKYAHPDSTTWADGVNQYMEIIANLELN
jgi:hypothetical protein